MSLESPILYEALIVIHNPLLQPSQPTMPSSSIPNTNPLTLDSIDSLSESLNIARRDTRHRDPAILRGIHRVLLRQHVHLLRVEAGVGEHADLAGDVAPVVLGSEVLEVLLEERAHRDDAVRHALDLAQPLLVQLGVVEDLGRDARAVDRWVGVERAHDDLHLRVNTLLLVGVGADDRESSDTLAVETLYLLAFTLHFN